MKPKSSILFIGYKDKYKKLNQCMFHGTKKNLNIYVGISPLTSSNFNSIYAYFCFPNGIITWFCEFQHSFRLLERFITQRIYEIE